MAIIVLGLPQVLSHLNLIPADRVQIPLWPPMNQALEQVGERLLG